MRKLPVKEDGFTLIELVIAMALVAAAGVGAMELMVMIKNLSDRTVRSNSHLEFHVELVKTLTQGVSGLKKLEIDDHLTYSSAKDGKIERVNSSLGGSELAQYEGEQWKVTSHRFRKRIDTNMIEYYSVCIPKDAALDYSFKDISSLRRYEIIPFIKVIASGHAVNCCPREKADCTENAITSDSKYILQTYRYESRANSITPVLVQGAWGALSGVGFYIFKDRDAPRLIRARVLTFFNECLSQDVFFKRRNAKCSTSLRVKYDEIVKDFDYSMEGINQLGGDLSL